MFAAIKQIVEKGPNCNLLFILDVLQCSDQVVQTHQHIPLTDMLHQQRQCGHPAMVHDFIVINDSDINQRKRLCVYFSRKRRILKTVQPVHAVRVRAALTVIEQHRNDQWQRFVLLQMSLHRRHTVA
uniref:Uncharacterized protein n=1 Tax=Escherichia coli TaxID=562 RepID=A0A3G4RT12_ECOLX|nr:hypothetical protein D0368_00037 [Escherichia coli]